jgi:hypothetical protein
VVATPGSAYENVTVGRDEASTLPEGDLDWPVASVREDGVTELRVHGVGGTPPQDMLDEVKPKQVTGDRIAGMWRGTDQRQGWHREAYAWGGLTSRALTSALWLVLLPFALLNVAGWTALDRRDWLIGYQQTLIRVIGLVATWSYVLFVALIAMDFGAWQCSRAITECRVDRIWNWLALTGHPARACVVAAAVPLLVILVLWRLSATSQDRYESYPPGDRGTKLDLPSVRLTSQELWLGGGYAKLLRDVHITSSVVAIAVLLLAAARRGGRFTLAAEVGLAVGSVLLAAAVVLAAMPRLREWLFGRNPRNRSRDRRVLHLLPLATVLALLAYGAVLAWLQPPVEPARPDLMPGMATLSNLLIAGAFAVALLLGAVSVIGRWRAGRNEWVGRAWLPGGPYLAAVAALFLLFGIWAGVAVWFARALSSDAVARRATAPATAVVYPGAFEVLTVLAVVALLAVLLVVGVAAIANSFWVRRRCKSDLAWELDAWRRFTIAGARRASADQEPGKASPWMKKARWCQWFAGSARWLEATLVGLVALGTAATFAYVAIYSYRWLGWSGLAALVGGLMALGIGLTLLVRGLAGPAGWRLVGAVGAIAGIAVAVGTGWWLKERFGDQPAPEALRLPEIGSFPLEGIATWVLTLVPIAGVVVLRQAITSPTFRRSICSAWDVATFFPRAFHPLAPPSYAERAVPELTTRVRGLLARENAVMLAGHSQGAVLTMAAVAQLGPLSPDQRARFSVITYGNPVVNLYQRWFPTYFDRDSIGTITECPSRWVNFFRYTDPVGRELFRQHRRDGAPPPTEVPEGSGDCWLPDPSTDLYREGDIPPVVRFHGHGGYLRQSAFSQHLLAEADRLTGDSGPDTRPLPASVRQRREQSATASSGQR